MAGLAHHHDTSQNDMATTEGRTKEEIVVRLTSPNKYIHLLDMWLHGGHSLNAAGTTANHDDFVLLPLFCLVILIPPGGVQYLALEFLDASDIGPFVVVENSCAVEQDMATIFKEARRPGGGIGLFELDQPLASLLLPVASNHFGVERHVFAQTPDFADFVQVFPDVRRV